MAHPHDDLSFGVEQVGQQSKPETTRHERPNTTAIPFARLIEITITCITPCMVTFIAVVEAFRFRRSNHESLVAAMQSYNTVPGLQILLHDTDT